MLVEMTVPDTPTMDVTLTDVERTLQRSLDRLRFPPAIEARFEADTGRARCRHLAISTIIGIVVFDLLLFSNQRMLPDVFGQALIVKLVFVTPALLAMLLVLRADPPAWLREGLQVFGFFAISIASLYLMIKSTSPLAAHAHYPLVLAAIYANLVQRLRFRHALGSSIAFFLIYSFGIHHLTGIPPEAASAAVGLMAMSMLCTLFANFAIERDQRRAIWWGCAMRSATDGWRGRTRS